MRGQRLPERQSKTSMDTSLAIVNIVLLLIFFFISTGSLLNSQGIAIALPETTELPLDRLPRPLLVIEADGTMTLDQEPVEPGTLAARTIEFPTLHVLADRETNATQVLEALDSEDLIAVEIKLVTIHRIAEGGDG